MLENYLIKQDWDKFSPQEHDLWSFLYKRQEKFLEKRAIVPFLKGLEKLNIASNKIPRFDDLTALLRKETGWSVVAVPGLVPDDIFFTLLAQRKFPSTCFLRRPDQIDYLQEPDIFHDIYGHIPLLAQPIFADYMEAYGRAGLEALKTNHLHYLARLYWYTVEFGLIHTDEGLRIYGSGIVSSSSESTFCLESPTPNRIMFDLKRIMKTNYRIDDFQETYFVVTSFEDLINSTTKDLSVFYEEIDKQEDLSPNDSLPTDKKYFI